MQLMKELADLYDAHTHLIGKTFTKSPKNDTDVGTTYTLTPIHHVPLNTFIEFKINTHGELCDIDVSQKIITAPTTIDSINRSVNNAPHILHDTLAYVAKDLEDYMDFKKSPRLKYDLYIGQLKHVIHYLKTHNKPYGKLEAVLKYVTSNNMIHDLCEHDVFGLDAYGHIIEKQPTKSNNQKDITPKLRIFDEVKIVGKFESIAVRFNIIDDSTKNNTPIWDDMVYIDNHIAYQNHYHNESGYCQITGDYTNILTRHPKRIRSRADGTRLISKPSNKNYITYQGRFGDNEQNTFTIGLDISLKAHAMLSFLIVNQARFVENRVYLTWSDKIITHTSDKYVLNTLNPMDDLNRAIKHIDPNATCTTSEKFQKILDALSIKDTDNIHMLVLDSTIETKGRLSVIQHQTYRANDYIKLFINWYDQYKIKRYHNAYHNYVPSIKDIAKAYCQFKDDDTAHKRIVDQLIQLFLRNKPIPQTISNRLARKVTRYDLFDTHLLYQKSLHVAACIIKGEYEVKQPGGYSMTLDKTNTDMSYLYGRLVAIAQRYEMTARHLTSDQFSKTHACRNFNLMLSKPAQGWRNINTGIMPYTHKLSESATIYFNKLLQEVMDKMTPDAFTSNKPLTNTFILGYYQQNAELYKPKNTENKDTTETIGGY